MLMLNLPLLLNRQTRFLLLPPALWFDAVQIPRQRVVSMICGTRPYPPLVIPVPAMQQTKDALLNGPPKHPPYLSARPPAGEVRAPLQPLELRRYQLPSHQRKDQREFSKGVLALDASTGSSGSMSLQIIISPSLQQRGSTARMERRNGRRSSSSGRPRLSHRRAVPPSLLIRP